MIRPERSDLAPLFDIRIRTERLELRLPDSAELVELAHLAEQGIHPPDFMPFLIPWTDAIGAADYLEEFLAFHLGARATWSPNSWTFNLGVWTAKPDGSPELIGTQSIEAEAFAQTRTAQTGSWLGQRYQRQGFGTEMREAVLTFAFAGLDAFIARSGAIEGNAASARVSEKLGYEPAGTGTVAPRGVSVAEQRYALTRIRWQQQPHPPVELVGISESRHLFGI